MMWAGVVLLMNVLTRRLVVLQGFPHRGAEDREARSSRPAEEGQGWQEVSWIRYFSSDARGNGLGCWLVI